MAISRRRFMGKFGAVAASPLIASLSGCDGEPRDGKVHLRYMAWGSPDQLDTEQELLNRFEAQNPDIKVKLFKVPGNSYKNKLVLMFASRTAPDVARVDHYDFPQLVRRGYFKNLSDFASQDKDYHESDFFPWTVEETKFKSHPFALNVLCGGNIIYYNKTMCDKEGLKDPYALWTSGEWTWNKLREHSIALSKRSGDRVIQMGFQFPSFVSQAPILFGYGADILSEDRKTCLLDSPEAIDAYEFLFGMRWRDHVSPTPGEAAQSFFKFESGRIGFQVDWMGVAPILRKTIKSFEWDICPVPRGPKAELTVCKGNQLVMNAETEHPEESWRLMRFMTGYEAEMFLYGKLRRSGPTRIAVSRSPEFLATELPPFHTDVYVTGMKLGKQLPIDERWPEWSIVATRHLDRLAIGATHDVKSVLRDLKSEVDGVLRDEEGF